MLVILILFSLIIVCRIKVLPFDKFDTHSAAFIDVIQQPDEVTEGDALLFQFTR